MDDLPRHRLRELIEKHGPTLCDDPRRCEALLRDACGTHKREIHVLVNALKRQLTEDLLGLSAGAPSDLLFARLATRLEDEQGLAGSVSKWAVESWAFALGVLPHLPSDSSAVPRASDADTGESELAQSEWEQVRDSTNIEELLAFERHFGFTSFGSLANSRRDDLTFVEAERTDSLDDFAHYLQQFPNGRHTAKVRERGAELSFLAAERTDTPEAYEAHLKNWPGGSFERKAREWLAQYALRLDRLDRAIAQDLAQTYGASIGAAVQQFLHSLPSDDARRRWDELARPRYEAAREPHAFSTAQKEASAQSYANYLKQFPAGAHAADAATALARVCLAHTLSHNDYVRALAFSPDNRLLLSAHWGGDDNAKTRIWNLGSGALVRKMDRDAYSFAFSIDGRYALSGGWKEISLWELANGEVVRTFSGHESAVYSLALSPDGHFLLSASGDRKIRLWEMRQRSSIFGSRNDGPLRTFDGHVDDVMSIAFSPDGRLALSGSADGTLKLWDVGKGREIRTLRGHSNEIVTYQSSDGTTGSYCDGKVTSVAFSPDGHFALSGSWDHTAKLWEIASGREIRSLQGNASMRSVSFSSDGRLALTASGDNTIAAWEVSSGRQMYALKGSPSTTMDGAAFSKDGFMVASVSYKEPIEVRKLEAS